MVSSLLTSYVHACVLMCMVVRICTLIKGGKAMLSNWDQQGYCVILIMEMKEKILYLCQHDNGKIFSS